MERQICPFISNFYFKKHITIIIIIVKTIYYTDLQFLQF